MTSKCKASSGPGSIAEALYHAFDLGEFSNEIMEYYLWAYSSYYFLRQTKQSSPLEEYTQKSDTLMSWEAMDLFKEICSNMTKDGCRLKVEKSGLSAEFWWPDKADEVWTIWAHRVRGPAIGRRTPKKIRKMRLGLVDLWSERHVP